MNRRSLFFVCVLALCASLMVVSHACFSTIECRDDRDCEAKGAGICVATVCKPCVGDASCSSSEPGPDDGPGDEPEEPPSSDRSEPLVDGSDAPGPAPCTDDGQCPQGQRCQLPEGRCEPGPCKADSDCATGQTCDTASGHCQRALCHPTQLIFNRKIRPFPHSIFVSATEIALLNSSDVEIWDVTVPPNGKKKRILDKKALLAALSGTGRENASFAALAFHRASNSLYAAHRSGLICRWTYNHGQWGAMELLYDVATKDAHGIVEISTIAVQPQKDGLLAIGTNEGKVHVLQTSAPTKAPLLLGSPASPVHAFHSSNGKHIPVLHLRFSPDGRLLHAMPPHYIEGVNNTPGARVWDPTSPTASFCDLGGKTAFLGDFHPSGAAFFHASLKDALKLYSFTQIACTTDQAKRYPLSGSGHFWRAGAYHPSGRVFAAMADVAKGLRFLFLDANDFSLLKQVDTPHDASFEEIIGTKLMVLNYNPWDPRYLMGVIQLPERTMIWKCP